MMNVATIGSGVIVERMIEAMRLDGRYNLYCVYSRTKKRAKEFAEKHGIQKYYTDMEEMLNDENVDIVYVASPNSYIIHNQKWRWNIRSMLLMKNHLRQL